MDAERIFGRAGCVGSLHAVRLANGAEVGYEADRPQVLASVVKVPIGLEFYAQLDAGLLDATTSLTLMPGRSTPGEVGISLFRDPVTISLRDLSYLMLSISDNAATDAVTAAVGIDAVNRRLNSLGCRDTVVLESIQSMIDGVATDLGFATYAELLSAQLGEMGLDEQRAATDPEQIDRCRALDPLQTSHSTARDATRLLAAIWNDTAASAGACAALRGVMAQQVTRRLAPALREGSQLAAKSGALFGRVRNEIAVITEPDGESYAVAVFTRANQPYLGTTEINQAMAISDIAISTASSASGLSKFTAIEDTSSE